MYETIYQSMELVTLFDAMIFFCAILGIVMYGWDLDYYVGFEARKKQEKKEKKFRSVMKSVKDDQSLVTKEEQFASVKAAENDQKAD